MNIIKKLSIICIFGGLLIGAFIYYFPQIATDSLKQLCFGILLVPLVFLINKSMEFNDYLRMLTKEIKDNLKLIEELPYWLQEVRTGERAWLPGIASNRPIPGYSLKYLSLNIYDNLINQKYWLYMDRGKRDKLAELYHYFRQYCDIIQELQTDMDITRNPVTEMSSNADFFYSDIRYNSRLAGAVAQIHHHVADLRLDDYNSFKNPEWWCPTWLKE